MLANVLTEDEYQAVLNTVDDEIQECAKIEEETPELKGHTRKDLLESARDKMFPEEKDD